MTADPYEIRYDRSPCGLLSTTAAGEIVEANATLLAWTGYTREQVLGRPLTSLLDPGSRLFFETRHAQVLHLRGSVDEVALTMLAADGSRVPVLVNSTLLEGEPPMVLSAIFNATQRLAYERELLDARRSAEVSERRLQILQDVSTAFAQSTTEADVAASFVQVARGAFAATEAAVMLLDENGELQLAAGVNPLLKIVPPIDAIRATEREIIVTLDDARADYPLLAAGLRATHLEALSATPLESAGRRLGLLVCFFGRRRDFDNGFFELQRALSRQASQTLVRVRLQRELEHLATFDQLTDVPNRQLVTQRLDDAIEGAATTGEPLTVVFIDVDDFKDVNDTHGHTAGDTVLRALAERFRDGVRAGDMVGRIGGDEFIAICDGADLDAANTIADRLLVLAREPIASTKAVLHVSVSVGASVYRPGTDAHPTADELLNSADDAMYISKSKGKNQIELTVADPDGQVHD